MTSIEELSFAGFTVRQDHFWSAIHLCCCQFAIPRVSTHMFGSLFLKLTVGGCWSKLAVRGYTAPLFDERYSCSCRKYKRGFSHHVWKEASMRSLGVYGEYSPWLGLLTCSQVSAGALCWGRENHQVWCAKQLVGAIICVCYYFSRKLGTATKWDVRCLQKWISKVWFWARLAFLM